MGAVASRANQAAAGGAGVGRARSNSSRSARGQQSRSNAPADNEAAAAAAAAVTPEPAAATALVGSESQSTARGAEAEAALPARVAAAAATAAPPPPPPAPAAAAAGSARSSARTPGRFRFIQRARHLTSNATAIGAAAAAAQQSAPATTASAAASQAPLPAAGGGSVATARGAAAAGTAAGAVAGAAGGGGGGNATQVAAEEAQSQYVATVRSEMYLKKNSLHLIRINPPPSSRPTTPSPTAPSSSSSPLYRLQFVADSTCPCKISVHIMAYEKDRTRPDAPPRLKSRLTLREPSAVGRLHGLDQTFITPEAKPLSFSDFEEAELTSTKSNASHTFPLVIRMQTIATVEEEEEEEKEVHDDEVGEGGGKAKKERNANGKLGHQQTLTTYATLVKNANGEFGVNVQKQVLWVGGVSYVLHEIFGMQAADGGDEEQGEGATANEKPMAECVICFCDDADTIVLPCRHLCLCLACAKALRRQSNRCPICRSKVDSVLKIKLGGANQAALSSSDAAAAEPAAAELAAAAETAGGDDESGLRGGEQGGEGSTRTEEETSSTSRAGAAVAEGEAETASASESTATPPSPPSSHPQLPPLPATAPPSEFREVPVPIVAQ